VVRDAPHDLYLGTVDRRAQRALYVGATFRYGRQGKTSMNRSVAVFLTTAFSMTVALSALGQGRADPIQAELDASEHMPDEVLVQYRSGTTRAERSATRGRIGGMHLEMVAKQDRRGDGGGDLELVRVPPGVGLADALASLAAQPSVEFAEPNWIYHHNAASNDTYYTNGSLWGMYGSGTSPANQYGSQSAKAWAAGHTCASTVYVGIIDEGYMYAHEDLAANAGRNPGETAGNGIDDDGNGLVDDVYGWDFAGGNASVFDGVGDDHGTHVAGTIGAVGGNARGVAGVCWQVRLLNAKFLGNQGGTTANAIKAVDYFTDLKTRHNLNLVATNNSWGGGGYSQALADAIARAGAANILFVAAAGNGGSDGVGDNNDATPSYPSSYENANVIAVAAIASNGSKSSFSNYGAATVDIGAPGSGIWSTVPKSSRGRIVSGYASYSGTSMATPHVTGAAALYAATHPDATAAQIKSAILGAAVPTPSLSGMTATGGRLDTSGF
jgi:subtilisin family serine protease